MHKNLKYSLIVAVTILVLTGIAFYIYWIVGKSGNMPWNGCKIPYYFNENLSITERSYILSNIQKIEQASSLKFTIRDKESEFIEFAKYTGSDENICSESQFSKQLGGQKILISDNCMLTPRYILRSILMALGFQLENQRPDRDDFIKIFPENAIEKYKSNLIDKASNVVYDKIIKNRPYDTKSIMHYHSYALSKNQLPIILDKKTNARIEATDVLSDEDKLRLKEYCVVFK
jgi:hypothetical protein